VADRSRSGLTIPEALTLRTRGFGNATTPGRELGLSENTVTEIIKRNRSAAGRA